MSLLDADSYKQRDMMASDTSLSKAPHVIQQSFYQGLYQTAYVTDIEIITNSLQSNLNIMIDGRVFGEYSHVRVTSVFSKDNKRLDFNLMTFVDTN